MTETTNSIKLIKEVINKNKISQYSLAEKSKIERSLLSKILNGSRKISVKNLLSLLEVLPIDEVISQQIVNAYIAENYGTKKYQDMINSIEKFQSPHLDNNLFNDQLLNEAKSAIQTRSGIIAYMSLMINQSKDYVYTNLPISSLLETIPNDNKTQIKVLYSAEENTNINVFDALNLYRKNCILYKPLTTSSAKSSTDIFPYYLLSDDRALLVNEDINNGIYINDADYTQTYYKIFNEKISVASSNIQTIYSEVAFEESTVNHFYGADHFCSISSAFPVVFCMDDTLWDELAKENLQNRQFLINTTSNYYYNWVESTGSLEYITTRQGLLDFCKYGLVELIPLQYQRPLSIQSRINILERMLYELENRKKKFSLRLINDKYSGLLNFLMLEASYNENDSKSQAIRCVKRADKTNGNPFDNTTQFLVTDKDLCEDYFKFFQLFQGSSYFLTEKETKHAIAQQIMKMKFLLQGDIETID